MTDFEKLRNALAKGEIIELKQGKDGSIHLRMTYPDDIAIGLSSPSRPEDLAAK